MFEFYLSVNAKIMTWVASIVKFLNKQIFFLGYSFHNIMYVYTQSFDLFVILEPFTV